MSASAGQKHGASQTAGASPLQDCNYSSNYANEVKGVLKYPAEVVTSHPLLHQVRRYEVLRLGVTYEAEVDCDVTRGLRYTWTLFDSAGRLFPLTLTDSHRQSLVLPSHLLQYDTYTATARVTADSAFKRLVWS